MLSALLSRPSLLLAPRRDIKKLADRKGVRACLLSRESQTFALCRISFIGDGEQGQIVNAIVGTISVYRNGEFVFDNVATGLINRARMQRKDAKRIRRGLQEQ